MDDILSKFVILWAVIDPIGTVPVFIAITKNYNQDEQKRIAKSSAFIAFCILLFFLVAGQLLLNLVDVPMPAFQVSGGVILFMFALDMIFGDSKPEGELQLLNKKSTQEAAVFPLAIPSIASPGAILAVMLLTDNSTHSVLNQTATALIMVVVLLNVYVLMRFAGFIHDKIGHSGAIVISKVMGMILASIAATNILLGVKEFFNIP